jgi:hypothetical protein
MMIVVRAEAAVVADVAAVGVVATRIEMRAAAGHPTPLLRLRRTTDHEKIAVAVKIETATKVASKTATKVATEIAAAVETIVETVAEIAEDRAAKAATRRPHPPLRPLRP